ncbi:aldehyde dehydrogenase family protein [Actinomadura sp. LD22]|uniref:Aldehyde dehydrogenase family protein n=2 Tax=Actinomadura physcomitrii TaxID=2650748 RepID=A0A6I4M7Z2_9ACTN|nr:aldehyde dehydrogenase family protein [Actinomadura physcomitrii]
MANSGGVDQRVGLDARLLIGGELVPAEGNATFDNVDPYSEKVLGGAPDASTADAEHAVAAARAAFDDGAWAADPAFRARCLRQLQQAARKAVERFRAVLVAEVGCPIVMTRDLQLETTTEEIEYWAGLAEGYPYRTWLDPVTTAAGVSDRLVIRDPVGVVTAITPYNYPYQQIMLKLGPALAAGNCVILKPSPLTPWTANLFAQLVAEETDIPAGVVNVLTGSSDELGRFLVADPRVDMVTFTGSTAVGRMIAASAGQTAKNVVMELGGKSANILLDDADIAAGVRANVLRMSRHAGQGCSNLTRLLLPRSRYEEGLEVAAEAAAAVPWGDPSDPTTHMGPLISDAQRDKVLGHIERGIADGARLVAGGRRPDAPHGYFVEATVLADVHPDSYVAQEEAFGPVLAVIPYSDDDEAVAIANNSRYGLAGAVSSASPQRAFEVAQRIRTAIVDTNGAKYYGVDTPRGGMRESGVGDEYGVGGFESFTEARVISAPAGAIRH